MQTTSNQSIPNQSTANQSTAQKAVHPSAEFAPSAKARSSRPRQQFSTLKLALAAGGIAATLLGTQLIAARDNTSANVQAPAVTAIQDTTNLDTANAAPLTDQPIAPNQLFTAPTDNGATLGSNNQANSSQSNQSPFFNSAPRQSFRPLTRSRSSR